MERSIRPIALNRKNALFAGHDRGGLHWGIIASLIETSKLNAVDPQAYLAEILTRLVNGWPMSKIDELMPWAHAEAAQNAPWPENTAYCSKAIGGADLVPKCAFRRASTTAIGWVQRILRMSRSYSVTPEE